jgi:hypothetical protein
VSLGGAGSTGYGGRVQSGATARIGRIARLVLLACTLFGLAVMHTIGHSGMAHADHHHDAASADSRQIVTLAAVAAGESSMTPADSDGCAADGCMHQAAMSAGDGGQMDRWGLCVAIMTAFVIAVLLVALLLSAVAGRSPPRSGRDRRRTLPRAPPWPRVGLTLATVSVLRT